MPPLFARDSTTLTKDGRMSPSKLTTEDLARIAVPFVRTALTEAEPTFKAKIGWLPWVTLKPAWWVVKGPMLPWIVKVCIEIEIGITAPKLAPIVNMINSVFRTLPATVVTEVDKEFLEGFTALVNTEVATMMPECRQALATAGSVQWRN